MIAPTAAWSSGETAVSPTPVQTVLPNGLKVVVLEDHSFPVVSTLMWYHVGARNEVLGSTGVSHLLEHLLFGAVGPFRKGEIAASIVRNGGQFNGYTSDDFTTFFETLPPPQVELALKIESQRMRGAHFAPGDITEEISNIQNELDRHAHNRLGMLKDEVRSLAYQQHPYHNPTRGWPSDIRNLTYKQVRSFYDLYYWPNNATLVMVGDLKALEALHLVQRYFGSISKSRTAIPQVKISESPQQGERSVHLKYPGPTEFLVMSYHAPAIHDSDAAAVAVIEKLFNAAFTGRLKSKLLDSKIAHSANATFEAKKDPGLFTFTCQTAPGHGLQTVLDPIEASLRQLETQPVSESELKTAKKLAEFALLDERDGPYHMGFQLGYFDSLSQWQNACTWAERIRNVTAGDLMRVARRYFRPDNRTIGRLTGIAAARTQLQKPKSIPATDTPPPRTPIQESRIYGVGHSILAGYKTNDLALGPVSTASPKPSPPACAPNVTTVQSPPVQGTDHQLPGGETPAAMPSPIQQRILKNGLHLVVFQSHLCPLVELEGSIRAGSVFEPPGKKGLSALTASALNGSSSKHSRAQAMIRQEELGLPPNAMLQFEKGWESITFRTRCLSRDLASQVAYLAEILTTPAFDDNAIAKAVADTASSVKKRESSLADQVDRVTMQNLLSPDCPFHPANPSDVLRSLYNLKPADVRTFYSQHISPASITLVLAGDVTIDQAAQMLEIALEGWSGHPSEIYPHAQANNRHILKSTLVSNAKQSLVCFGRLLPVPLNQPEYGKLLSADCCLTGHPMFSRLGQHCAFKPSTTTHHTWTSLKSTIEPVGGMTAWFVSLHAAPDTVSQAVQSMRSEMKSFTQSGIDQMELAEVKRYLTGLIPVQTMSNIQSAAQSILQSITHDGPAEFLPLLETSIHDTTVESLNKFIRYRFKPDSSSLVVAGCGKSIKSLQRPASPHADLH